MNRKLVLLVIAIIAIVSSCHRRIVDSTVKTSDRHTQKGKASYYSDKLNGHPTSSGELYDSKKNTAAHRSIPFGTKVKVTNLVNGKSVWVKINDRGPFVAGRIIDLSKAAAVQIDMLRLGVTDVILSY